ncbi:MAG TPA: energy transducer TonB [Dongiaceae bacterium]|nr:energy transducer TonB [Dongiaceae bacterium]
MDEHPRRKRPSSKVNLTFSIIFHSVLLAVVFFFAAREGLVGKKMQALTATLVPKEKKAEPPKAKPEEPKVEEPKVATTPKPNMAPPKVESTAPPPDAAPAAAPEQVVLPSFQFSDGAHEVQSISNPVDLYKALIESSIRSRWNRPEDIDDSTLAAEVELDVDPKGRINGTRWVSGSGNQRWDNSIKSALAETPALSQPPPKGFPEKFIVRFDVAMVPMENSLQVGGQ